MGIGKQEILEADYDELLILKEWVEQAIQKKKEENRVKIWELSVDNFIVCYGSSRESVMEIAQTVIGDSRNGEENSFRLEINPKYVRESEVDEHLEM